MQTVSCSSDTLDAFLGKPVELSPWSYVWRRDRTVQEIPEAYFIPRRLKRIDEVYRTALPEMGDSIKSYHYIQEDLLHPLLPKPENPLLTGLLWVGGLTDYQVELVWPQGTVLPAPEEIEVRTYPTAWGWFGWTVDRRLEHPVISQDGRKWVYPCPVGLTMDFAYNARVAAATEMIAVFAREGCEIPQVRVTGKSLGRWKSLSLVVEWGSLEGVPDFEGIVETHLAIIGKPVMEPENKRATFTCLYSADSRFGTDSRLTCILDKDEGLGASVLLRELAEKPICVPEIGLFFHPADMEITEKEYLASQKAAGQNNIRQMVRQHPEASSWEEIFRNLRLWRCPDGTELPPFPKAPAASVALQVPDKRWQTMYENAVEQLRGPHMWGHLATEVARVTLAMEMIGLYAEADRIYDYFLASPGVKSDGDFTDPAGSLEWAKDMRHDMGYNHEGTHFSTGKLLFSMIYRYYLTEDTAWLKDRLPRLKEAAEWIIRELHEYMKDIPNRESLPVAGLMPPSMTGDYALPACDWRWYYCDNAFSQMGLSGFADVLERIGDKDAAYFRKEAAQYEKNLLCTVKREALYAPVRRGRDGISRSFIPRMAYAGGLLHYGSETNIPQFAMGINDLFQGALPLGEIGGVMAASDRRMVGTIDAMEEAGTTISLSELEHLEHPTANQETKEKEEALAKNTAQQKRSGNNPTGELWFWNSFSNLPKISHNANIYLRQDDIPNFLRFFFHHAVMMVGSNGKLWEHAHPDLYVECENPDNGTVGWFIENFRNMLLTEDDDILWLAKGTPRAWLEQGKSISVHRAPTWYGELDYTIISDVSHQKIIAQIQVPSRRTPPTLKLRLRHPQTKKLSSVTVNGAVWKQIDADGETITLPSLEEKLDIIACY